MTRVIQVLVPCTDDFIGPFESEGHAGLWVRMQGLEPYEHVVHDMIDPANTRASQEHWSRLSDSVESARMLVLSTAHLEEKTCNGYLAECPWAAFPKGDYGWFVYVPEDAATTETVDVPLGLRSVMHFARMRGYQWVMYDRDAPEIPDLPIYDW